jgi:hypothetical protein
MVNLPGWLNKMPEGPAKIRATKLFYMKLVSVHATPAGTFTGLARALGMFRSTLEAQATTGALHYRTRGDIHRLTGILIPWDIN